MVDGKWDVEQRADAVCVCEESGKGRHMLGRGCSGSQEYARRRIRPDRFESAAADQTTPHIWVRVQPAGRSVSYRGHWIRRTAGQSPQSWWK